MDRSCAETHRDRHHHRLGRAVMTSHGNGNRAEYNARREKATNHAISRRCRSARRPVGCERIKQQRKWSLRNP